MKRKKPILIKNANIINQSEVKKGNVLVRDGRIESVNKNNSKINNVKDKDLVFIDASGKYLSAGFIDIHTHGSSGADPSCRDFSSWIDHNLKNGVTSFLPTILTMPIEDMISCINHFSGKIRDGVSGIIGINLEGPYLNPLYGMQLAEYCIKLRRQDYNRFLEAANGIIKIMTVAPELDGSYEMIKDFIKNDVIISIGHTDASKEQTEETIRLGAKLTTHIFNAFGYPSGLLKESRKGKVCGIREVKALDVVLEDDDIYAEVISDKNGVHVSPVFLKILVKCKPIDKIILITDSMKSRGLPSGDYILPDGRVYIINENEDVFWLKDKKVLSGSALNLKDAVVNLMEHTGLSLIDAVKTVTINPARLLGLDRDIGSIDPGKKANMIVFDKDLNICHTFLNGVLVYEA